MSIEAVQLDTPTHSDEEHLSSDISLTVTSVSVNDQQSSIEADTKDEPDPEESTLISDEVSIFMDLIQCFNKHIF